MTAWITLIVASVLTLGLRAGPSLVRSDVTLPRVLQRANRFAAPALMGALASRSVVAQAAAGGEVQVVAAIAVAVPFALRTRSMACTVAAGTAAFVLAAALL